ncbi:hypothetical protein GOQ30_08280 [Flavobacterium sp. TP390]|uniref:Uncharacterized protein n=1 Tax=Flavobacterium profundi TaxID=1774945 RepID=A0A6I4ISK4_9FLAO|nr:hypothetical protein [Flavobacterium profundi]MVO09157.1 hypothetical protein [Flavobacterium profundi]
MNNLDLYIVAEYYDVELMDNDYNLNNPIFGIDTEFYKTNLTDKYLKKFIVDLTDQYSFYDRFYLFENGEYKSMFKSIENLNSL